jgi:hypothetical protein
MEPAVLLLVLDELKPANTNVTFQEMLVYSSKKELILRLINEHLFSKELLLTG